MEIKDIQKQAIEAIDFRLGKKSIKPTTDLILMHLMEELGELTLQFNNVKLKRKDIDLKNVGEEISDCMALLLYLAKMSKIDLEKAFPEKMEEIRKNR